MYQVDRISTVAGTLHQKIIFRQLIEEEKPFTCKSNLHTDHSETNAFGFFPDLFIRDYRKKEQTCCGRAISVWFGNVVSLVCASRLMYGAP